jgi:hypothetical protein
MLFHGSTGMPVADARDDFLRARRAQVAARLEVIPLKTIVGTVEPTIMFDADFRPASELVRTRWERIALAHRRAVSLPPISVLRGEDGYYVVDGRHRVSVALALGRRDIDAWVTPVRTVSSSKSAEAA